MLSKLGVALFVICLITSCITLKGTLKRNTELEDLTTITKSVAATIKTTQGLPGRVDLKRELPPTHQTYSIRISGSYENFQKICILAKGTTENVLCVVFIGKIVNNGNFKIERKNPSEILIKKSEQISLEVI